MPGVTPSGGVSEKFKFVVPALATDCTETVSPVSDTSPSPFQSAHTPTRPAALIRFAVEVTVTGTGSVVAVPMVNAGIVRSSSSPILSSPEAVEFAGFAASASVAAEVEIPMRKSAFEACVATPKTE